jgi:RNA polymerase sigma factor (sigma-70 family)
MHRSVEDVYRATAPAVLGFFRSHGMRDAEDLTGDVFVSVAEHLSRFRGSDAALRRWVFTLAHHRMVDEFRRSGRSILTPATSDHQRTVESADALDADLVRAMSTLTDEQRQVVVLRFVADLSLRDVSKITGRRTGAIKMAQARGLLAVREALTQTELPEPIQADNDFATQSAERHAMPIRPDGIDCEFNH